MLELYPPSFTDDEYQQEQLQQYQLRQKEQQLPVNSTFWKSTDKAPETIAAQLEQLTIQNQNEITKI